MSKEMVERLAIMQEKHMLNLRAKVLKLFDRATRLRHKETLAKQRSGKPREKEPTLEAMAAHLIAGLKLLNQQDRDGIKRRLLATFRQADQTEHRYDRKHLALVDGRKS